MSSIPQDTFNTLPMDVQQYITAIRQHSVTMEQQINQLTDAVAQGVAQHHHQSRAPKLPDPRTFDGNRNTRALQDYLYDVQQHFDNEPSKFSDERTKIRFAAAYLKGAARTWFQSLDEANQRLWNTYREYVHQLKQTFGELDPQSYWLKRWDSLQQRGPVASYLAEFNIIATHLDLTEEIKYHHFKKGLKSNILDQLALQPKPNTLEDLILLANQIDARLFEHQRQRFPTSSIRSNDIASKPRTSQDNPRPASNPRITWPNNQPIQPGCWTTPADNRMQVDNIQRYGPLTSQEKDRRRLHNLCLYCGKPGHMADQCNLKRKNTTHPTQGK